MDPRLERRLLQASVLIAALVPVGGGIWGVLGGMDAADARADSHSRYLSGLLLGVGLTFCATVSTLERQGAVWRALAVIVVLGGLARLAAVPQTGAPPDVLFPLVMELGVTPLLALWREGVERRITRTGWPRPGDAG